MVIRAHTESQGRNFCPCVELEPRVCHSHCDLFCLNRRLSLVGLVKGRQMQLPVADVDGNN